MPAAEDPAEPTPFGALLARFRRAAGLTQEALAQRAGLSARGISDLERGLRRAPQRETVRLLAGALGLGPPERAALQAAARQGDGGTGGARRRPPGPVHLPDPATALVGREREV